MIGHDLDTEVTFDPDFPDFPFTLRAWCWCGWDAWPTDFATEDEAYEAADSTVCPRLDR